MKKTMLMSVLLMGVFAAQAFADTTYYCNQGYMTVTLSADQKGLEVIASEWGGDYRVSKDNASEFNAVLDRDFDRDLAATKAYVSQSMLEGAQKASITLKGGEDANRYDDCKLN